jgi:hypothetical protein
MEKEDQGNFEDELFRAAKEGPLTPPLAMGM